MKILFVGGGSVGHLAPSVAVFRELKRVEPLADALFVCTEKPGDQEFLSKEGVPFETLPLLGRSLALPWSFVRAVRKSKRILKRHRPDVVFSKGGSTSIPLCCAAKRRRIPIVLHESDAVAGYASRLIARLANKICTGFPHAIEGGEHTGNPVRPDVTRGSREKGLSFARLSGKKPVLLVLGGSQGAEALNGVTRELLPQILNICDVIHLTGAGKEGAPPRPGYYAFPFAYTELPHLYAAATIALSRSGAGALSELAANGIPTILCPLRFVAQDHQRENATEASARGGCVVLEQSDLKETLLSTIRSMLEDDKHALMASAFRSFAKPEAAGKIASLLQTVATRK
ncbi:MAG: UDP-N-acetylglucosamine--N-acetylmuramyl-(pentapeptide) pyrophosphoryl-undecaprenol N-acetylglucosamine transferase [Patescibacteria group bacterium]